MKGRTRISDSGDGVITAEAARGAAVGGELQNWTKRESGSASGRFHFPRMRTTDPELTIVLRESRLSNSMWPMGFELLSARHFSLRLLRDRILRGHPLELHKTTCH